MATTQYIGARYVPLFYENSDGTSEWRSGVKYEPLTIVTWNGNSYTSKKPVPENIGNPSDNLNYWVATGIYNEQINEILEEIAEINEDLYGFDFVNVKQFGAVGDGETDDTEAFRQAFTNHLNIYIPAGTYLISDTLYYKSGMRIVGANRNTSVIRFTHVYAGLSGNAAALTMFTHIENVKFEYYGQGRTEYPIIFINSRRLLVSKCVFMNLDGVKTYAEILVTKNTNAAGSVSHRFVDNYFYKTRISFSNTTDSWFMRNDLNCITDDYSVQLNNASGFIVSDNQFIAPLEINGGVGMLITNNYFDGYVAHDIPDRWNAINIKSRIRSCVIGNNRFYELPGSGVNYTGTPGLQDVNISGNTFEFCDCFNDGLADIEFGSAGASTPCIIANNIGNRYTSWEIDGEGNVTSGRRTASAPFFRATGGTLSRLSNNVAHDGYTPTLGDYVVSRNHNDNQLFQAHYYGAITSSSGLQRFNIAGMVGVFQNAPVVLNDFPCVIRGRYHTALLEVSGNDVFITHVYDSSGNEVADISGYAVHVTSPKS